MARLLSVGKGMAVVEFRGRVWSLFDEVVDQHHPENRKHRVHSQKAEQAKKTCACADVLGIAFRGSNQAVHKPWLATDLGCHPAGSIRNIRKRKTQKDWPQHPVGGVELAAPEEKSCDRHERGEVSPEPRHDVIAVEQKREGRRPLILGIFIEALYLGGGRAVDQKAQDLVDGDWVINLLAFDVRLPHQHDGRTLFRAEEALHSSDGNRLVLRHVLAVKVAGGKDLRDAGEDRSEEHTSELQSL